MKTNQIKRLVFAAIAAGVLTGPGTLRAAEPTSPAPPETQVAQNATRVEGVLTAKGENWIEVKAEGSQESVRYRARWIGGMPAQGGGPDKAMIATIKKLAVASRVSLTWQNEEGPRVVAVETVKPATEAGQGQGTVIAKSEKWIDIKSGDVTERYSPRWIGGMPAQGGGLDKDMLRAIAAVKVGDTVHFEWSYEERKRVLVLRAV